MATNLVMTKRALVRNVEKALLFLDTVVTPTLSVIFILVEVRKKKGFTLDAHGNRKEYEGLEVCGGELLEFIRKNRSLSAEFCTKLYQELFAPIQVKIEHEIETYTFKQLEADFMKLNEEYLKRAIGPEKWNVLSEMDKKTVEAQKSNFKKVKGYQEKVMKEKQRTKEAEIEARRRADELKKLHQEAIREKEKNAENLKNMQQNFQDQMNKVIVGLHWIALLCRLLSLRIQ